VLGKVFVYLYITYLHCKTTSNFAIVSAANLVMPQVVRKS